MTKQPDCTRCADLEERLRIQAASNVALVREHQKRVELAIAILNGSAEQESRRRERIYAFKNANDDDWGCRCGGECSVCSDLREGIVR